MRDILDGTGRAIHEAKALLGGADLHDFSYLVVQGTHASSMLAFLTSSDSSLTSQNRAARVSHCVLPDIKLLAAIQLLPMQLVMRSHLCRPCQSLLTDKSWPGRTCRCPSDHGPRFLSQACLLVGGNTVRGRGFLNPTPQPLPTWTCCSSCPHLFSDSSMSMNTSCCMQILDFTGVGTVSSLICGIDYVVANRLAGVITMSFEAAPTPADLLPCDDPSNPTTAMHQAICNAVNAGECLPHS